MPEVKSVPGGRQSEESRLLNFLDNDLFLEAWRVSFSEKLIL